MTILRFIDAEGCEQQVSDVNHLYELIQAGALGYDSLVWDDDRQRWVAARNHELFRRIREIAAGSPAAAPEPARSPVPAVPLAPQKASPAGSPWAAPPQPARSPVPAAPLAPHKASSTVSTEPRDPAPDKEPPSVAAPKTKWFKAIQTREEALKIINSASTCFFVVAGIQAAVGLLLSSYADSSFDPTDFLANAVLYVVFAAWLRWGWSRIAAVILLFIATIALAMTVGAQFKIIKGGQNIWLAVIVFWAAVKAVEATFKLRGRFKQPPATAEPQLI
jgi:hypothetical protein